MPDTDTTHSARARYLRLAAIACCALALILAALPASASARGGEVSIMDDQLLLNASQAEVDRTMALFRSFGVDRLRVSAFWEQLAPDQASRKKPAGFDAADPADPRYAFAALDRVVTTAPKYGLRVMLSVSTPFPVWASRDPSRDNHVWKPKPAEFAAFTTALVKRYAAFVDHWAVSNEPNRAAWLQPQADRRGRMISPHLYRSLVHASYPVIKQFDPDSVVLVGELASTGSEDPRGATAHQRPLSFLRAMACRDRANRPLRSGRCTGFRPVPVDAIGHHPYQLLLEPSHRAENRDDAAINDGPRLLRTLDRLTAAGALSTPGRRRLNVFYTEFGYQTNPPDPFAGVSLTRQRSYLQEAAYLAWRTPRVRGLNQFQLRDGAIEGSGADRFRQFQSGLVFRNRRRKPSYGVFPHPFVIRGDRFWGQVRPGRAHTVKVQRRARRGQPFRMVAQVLTDSRGYFNFELPDRGAGEYRYTYGDPQSRSGIVRVR